MSLLRDERYVIIQPRDDAILMGRYGTVDPNAHLFSYPNELRQHLFSHRGIVQDWDTLFKFWHSTYQQSMGISIRQGDGPVMILKPATYSKSDDELITKFWFEQCNVLGLFLCPSAVTSLLGANLTTGIAIDVGYSHIEIIPVYECTTPRADQIIIPYGIIDAIKETQSNLSSLDQLPNGWNFSQLDALSDYDLATKYPNLWSPILTNNTLPGDMTLPNPITSHPSIIIPGALRAAVAQRLIDQLVTGIIHVLDTKISDVNIRPQLAESLVLCGLGSYVTENVPARLEKEINSYLCSSNNANDSQPRSVIFRIVPPYLEAYTHRPDYVSYLGGSLLSRAVFPDIRNYITRDEYEQYGPSIVHTKNYGATAV